MAKNNAIISGKNELVKLDYLQWWFNLRKFVAPVAVIYLTSIVGVVQQENHVISRMDLIPTNFVLGAMSLYLLNGLIDLFNKWSQKITYKEGSRTVEA